MEVIASNTLTSQEIKILTKSMPSRFRGVFAKANRETPEVLISVARVGEALAGVAVAYVHYDEKKVEYVWIAVEPEYRNQGCAKALVIDITDQVTSLELSAISMIYPEHDENRVAYEKLFLACGYTGPEVNAFKMVVSSRKAFTAPWMKNIKTPKGADIFLWKDLSKEDEAWLRECGIIEMNVPDVLNPFRYRGKIEPLNSLGIKKDGKVVGWMINNRVDPFTIRYAAIFIRENLQGGGWILPLIWKAMDLQFNGGNMFANRCEYIIEPKTPKMDSLSRRRFAQYCDEAYTQYEMKKSLK